MQVFTVYSKPNCTYCDQAKALLEQQGVQYAVINLDVGQPRQEGQEYISRDALVALMPAARTMPQIVKHDSTSAVHIGGYEDLKRHLHS
jgi:glutaredoxin